jgi:hypothetical protein
MKMWSKLGKKNFKNKTFLLEFNYSVERKVKIHFFVTKLCNIFFLLLKQMFKENEGTRTWVFCS